MLVNVAYGEIQQSELKSTFTADVVTSGWRVEPFNIDFIFQ
jgi:hypothetical protein